VRKAPWRVFPLLPMNPAEFDFIASSEEKFWWYRGMRRIMFRLFDTMRGQLPSRSFVLEAGCGTGFFAKAMTERYGWRIVPVDLGSEGLAYAKALGVTNLAQCNIASLPLRSNCFDAVVSMDVIVHFPKGEEGQSIAEMFRVLKPGGHLFLRVSALEALRSRHSIHVLERQRFTRNRLIRAVRAQGFSVDWCSYANSILSPVAFVKFRIVEPLIRSEETSGVKPVSPWLDKILHAALKAEAHWLGKRSRFPIGQSLILIARKPS
jgi:ubiquinone/menaquinone biosynthesis C-methylase UbiE